MLRASCLAILTSSFRVNIGLSSLIPVSSYLERSTLATCSTPSQLAPRRCRFSTQRPTLNSSSDGNKTEGYLIEGDRDKDGEGPKNEHGERITLKQARPPPGYGFLSAGQTFKTETCRKLGQDMIVVHRPGKGNLPAEPIGLYVPNAILRKAETIFHGEKIKHYHNLRFLLDKKYPLMPPRVRAEVHQRMDINDPIVMMKPVLESMELKVYACARDNYTKYRSLALTGTPEDAKAQTHDKVQHILTSWRTPEAKGEASQWQAPVRFVRQPRR